MRSTSMSLSSRLAPLLFAGAFLTTASPAAAQFVPPPPPIEVPEPAALTMFGLGVLSIAALRRRKD